MSGQRSAVVWLAALTVAGGILRVYGLGDALNHDESYTVDVLATRPYGYILTHYPLPNNHPLHTALVRLSMQLFGASEWVTRLPAYVAGVASIPVIYHLVRAIAGSTTGALIGAAMLTVMPVHISYSSTARGYSLAMLLCAFALMSAWRALRGGIAWWIVYACASLLAVYTLPSVALFCATLAAWSLVYSAIDDRAQLRSACAANAALLAGVFLGYWPLRHELQDAASQFGLAIDGNPAALIELIGDATTLAVGGYAGLLPGLLALAALGLSLRRDKRLGMLVLLLWAGPFALTFAAGTGAAARGYLFLLPVFVLAASCGIQTLPLSRFWRACVGTIALSAYGWAAVDYAATREPREGSRAIGSFLVAAEDRGEIVVSPYIMDQEVWHYAQSAIERGVVSTVTDRVCHGILFAADAGQSRFDLDSYLLNSTGMKKSVLTRLDRSSFETVFSSGSKRVYRLRGTAEPMFGDSLTWVRSTSDQSEMRAWQASPPLYRSPALQVEAPSPGMLRLYSQETLQVPEDGLAVVTSARTDIDSEVSLYEITRDGEAEAVELHVLETSARPIVIRGKDKQIWKLGAFAYPVFKGREYGLYIGGGRESVQSFAEILAFYHRWQQ